MSNVGFIFWLIGLSIMVFFAIAWLLDIGNRQRQFHERVAPLLTGLEETENAPGYPVANQEQLRLLQSEIEGLKTDRTRAIQAVGLVRFQAFSDYGGDQSFALALANVTGEGVVISSIFARDGARVYAKPLQTWTSPHSLSFEEEAAINLARRQLEEQTRVDENN